MTVLALHQRHLSPSAPVQTSATGDMAKVIADLLREVRNEERRRAIDWHQVVYAQIEELMRDCSVDNWDGYGARAVLRSAKENVQRFVELLPSDIPEPSVVVDPDGHIALCWDFGRDRIFTISVGETEVATYAGLLGKGVKRHGQEPFREDVPKVLLESIREIAPVR